MLPNTTMEEDNISMVEDYDCNCNDSLSTNISTLDMCDSHMLTKQQWAQYRVLHYWMEGVVQVALSSIGLLATSFSILILTRKQLVSKLFNKLLTAMAIFDSIYLLIMFYEGLGTFKTNKDTDWFYVKGALTPFILHPVAAISMTASIYIMMAVAVERYIAVCRPFNRIPPSLQQGQENHQGHKTLSRLRHYLIPVIIFSIFINFTKFFETTFCENCPNKKFVRITELRFRPIYLEINAFARLLFLGIIPVVVTSVLNYKIYLAVRKSTVGWPQNSILLFLIVFIFIVCNLPRTIILMHEITVLEAISLCKNHYWHPFWNFLLGCISEELLVLIPLLNFFAYCVAGRTFREVTCDYTSRLIPCLKNYAAPDHRRQSTRMIRMNVLGNAAQTESLLPRNNDAKDNSHHITNKENIEND